MSSVKNDSTHWLIIKLNVYGLDSFSIILPDASSLKISSDGVNLLRSQNFDMF